jgi:hypothetical protein
MTKSNKQDELAEALLEWAEEDEENRSVMLFACDEENVRKTYHGSGENLVLSLANALLEDEELFSLFATAIHICRTKKANDDDEA